MTSPADVLLRKHAHREFRQRMHAGELKACIVHPNDAAEVERGGAAGVRNPETASGNDATNVACRPKTTTVPGLLGFSERGD
jgi:hypothetical protein